MLGIGATGPLAVPAGECDAGTITNPDAHATEDRCGGSR